jgi:hypothetical protein
MKMSKTPQEVPEAFKEKIEKLLEKTETDHDKKKRSGGCLGLLLVGFILSNFLVNI